VCLSVLVNTLDVVEAAERVDGSVRVDLVTGQVVVANKVEAGLVNVGSEWNLLSLQKLGEGITAVIGVVHFANLN